MQTSKKGFFEVVEEILTSIQKESPTGIAHGYNLNIEKLPSYLNYLAQIGLISKTHNRNGQDGYRLTAKGRKFLKRYDRMLSLLGENGRLDTR